MTKEDAQQFWDYPQLEATPVAMIPPQPVSQFRLYDKSFRYFMREDGRLTKALELLRGFHYAEQYIPAGAMRQVRDPADYQRAILEWLTQTLSSLLGEQMVTSQYTSEECGQKIDIHQASIVFLPPEAARYIADTLEAQERKIAKLEQQVRESPKNFT